MRPAVSGIDLAAWTSAGEDIVIGVIDSGIWPESESFSDRADPRKPGKKGKKIYRHLRGWHGKCKPGEAFPASKCNQKLIGARRFNEAWGGDAGVKAQRPWEFASPRDYNGHGTHTASTAGGNNDVELTGPAAIFGSASGIAPRARISVYKALWSNAGLHRRPPGSRPISSPRSIRRSPTAWTSSTTRSAAH